VPGDHYFSRRPAARGERRVLTVSLRGRELRLATEAGVFSRSRVDRGTRLLIEHMEIGTADRVLDLGCGYGVVGLVAAGLASEGRVTLVDINERAAALARENLRANGIENAEAFAGDGFAPIASRIFDVIAFNPPIRAGNAVIHQLIEQAKDHLAPAGRFYLVGRTQQGVVRLAAKTAQVFGQVQEVAKGGGYRVYLAHRPS
jgi:16S rRNA (guanine1207-N2)-methyltransferase